MKFIADENFDAPIISALRQTGYDVLSVKENFPKADDETVLNKANEEKRILLTCDKDFGELVYRLQLISSGIVLFRLADLSNADKVKLTLEFIKQHAEKLAHSFSVVTNKKIRVIKL